jgi:23S rRNA (pseudouridine1915-N3)-methyltransferase
VYVIVLLVKPIDVYFPEVSRGCCFDSHPRIDSFLQKSGFAQGLLKNATRMSPDMKIFVLNVGKVRQSFIKDGEQEYLKRLQATPLAVSLVELGLEAPGSLSPEELREREGIELLKRLETFEYIIALDERGKRVGSKDFASLLSKQMVAGTRSLAFVIGGAYGFSEKIRQRANYVLSLSDLTLPHQLTRLVLIEQIYRAYTLHKGIDYHK